MAHPGHDDAGSSAHTVPRQALASRLHSPRARRTGRIRVLSRDQLMNRPLADGHSPWSRMSAKGLQAKHQQTLT